MKGELISNIEPEEYDREIYPRLVVGLKAGQLTTDGDMLIIDNPESKYYVSEPEFVEPPFRPPSRPQGVLNLEFYPNSNQPYEAYVHPQRPRGNRR